MQKVFPKFLASIDNLRRIILDLKVCASSISFLKIMRPEVCLILLALAAGHAWLCVSQSNLLKFFVLHLFGFEKLFTLYYSSNEEYLAVSLEEELCLR